MNNKINCTPKKIPNVIYQRSSSIPTRKKIDNSRDNSNIIINTETSNKKQRENSRARIRPPSRNFRDLQEEREEQATKLEEEILILEKENALLNKRNNDFDLFLEKLKCKNESLSLQIKANREKILTSQKLKNNLMNKLSRIKKDMELSKREFEMFRNVKVFKLNIVNNNIQNAKNFSEDRKNSFERKIQSELENKTNLERTLSEVKNKIKHLTNHLMDIREKRNKSANKIFREKREMEKFLINI